LLIISAIKFLVAVETWTHYIPWVERVLTD